MTEIAKTQNIRLIDILFLGPIMTYAGFKYPLPPLVKYTLLIGGIATILYNANNFVRQQKALS